MRKLHPILGSSVDATKLAMTWKGLILTLVPILVATLGLADITVSPESLVDVINTLFATITAGITAYGAIRKVVVSLNK